MLGRLIIAGLKPVLLPVNTLVMTIFLTNQQIYCTDSMGKMISFYIIQQGYTIRCLSLHSGAMFGKDTKTRKKVSGVADGVSHVRMGAVHDGAYIKDQMILSKGEELTIDGCMLAGNNAVPKKHE